jgi:hypothetical protein
VNQANKPTDIGKARWKMTKKEDGLLMSQIYIDNKKRFHGTPIGRTFSADGYGGFGRRSIHLGVWEGI